MTDKDHIEDPQGSTLAPEPSGPGPGRWVPDPDDPEYEVWETAPKEVADDRPDDDLSWQDGRQPTRTCSAHRTNGKPCRKAAINGGTVCATHGGRAPQVKRAARARLENAADRMAKELLKIAVSDDAPDSVKLSAIKDALDRAGLSAKTAVEVSVDPKPFEQVLDVMFSGGSRAGSRSRRGEVDDADPEHDWIDAEIVLAEIATGGGQTATAHRPRTAPVAGGDATREVAITREVEEPKGTGYLPLEDALVQLRRTAPPPQAPAARRKGRR
ncbi:MAG: hypothetical protein QM809_18710 [Gordonia sp. (in: high G+C Gram-positive bacteria)]|uniref:hypothetical protein n=1 Tax=Gordonia sp. (in: high G+C Gram-positive bacteria) TaxID=84139 RepID=UPI0039E3E97C